MSLLCLGQGLTIILGFWVSFKWSRVCQGGLGVFFSQGNFLKNDLGKLLPLHLSICTGQRRLLRVTPSSEPPHHAQGQHLASPISVGGGGDHASPTDLFLLKVPIPWPDWDEGCCNSTFCPATSQTLCQARVYTTTAKLDLARLDFTVLGVSLRVLVGGPGKGYPVGHLRQGWLKLAMDEQVSPCPTTDQHVQAAPSMHNLISSHAWSRAWSRLLCQISMCKLGVHLEFNNIRHVWRKHFGYCP